MTTKNSVQLLKDIEIERRMSSLLFVLYGQNMHFLYQPSRQFYVTTNVAPCAGWYASFENKFNVGFHCDYAYGNVAFKGNESWH